MHAYTRTFAYFEYGKHIMAFERFSISNLCLENKECFRACMALYRSMVFWLDSK